MCHLVRGNVFKMLSSFSVDKMFESKLNFLGSKFGDVTNVSPVDKRKSFLQIESHKKIQKVEI